MLPDELISYVSELIEKEKDTKKKNDLTAFKAELEDHFPSGVWSEYVHVLDSKGRDILNRHIRLLSQEYKAADIKRNAMVAILISAFVVTLSLMVYGFCMISQVKDDASAIQNSGLSPFDIDYIQFNESDSSMVSNRSVQSDFTFKAKPTSSNTLSKNRLWAGVFLISLGVFVFIISNVAFATYFARKRGL
ncbi:MAG: hypothetical protein ABJG47_03885 [Ekhidna sp.]